MYILRQRVLLGLFFMVHLPDSNAFNQFVVINKPKNLYESIGSIFQFKKPSQNFQLKNLKLKASWPKILKKKLRGKDDIRQSLKENAAQFDLPVDFFSCLVFRESQFDPLARSHVGALGLGQIMQTTYQFLIVILEQGRRNSQNYDRFRSIKSSKKGYRKNEKLSYMSLWNYWVLKWGWEAETKFKEFKRGYHILKKPKMNLAASATYLKYLKLRFQKEKNLSSINKDALLAISGAYNQGPKILFRNPRWSTRKMIKVYSRIEETREYIKFISKCMSQWNKNQEKTKDYILI